MPHYQHLTVAERYQIFILLKAGFSYSAVALQLNRHRSTIHRELSRNLVFDYRVTGYSPSRADNLAWHRRRVKPHFKISAETWLEVIALLEQRWSPEQICYRRKLAGLSPMGPIIGDRPRLILYPIIIGDRPRLILYPIDLINKKLL